MIPKHKQEFKGFGKRPGVDSVSNTESNSQSKAQTFFQRLKQAKGDPTGKQGRNDWMQGTIEYTDKKFFDDVLQGISLLLRQECLLTPERSFLRYKHSGKWECKAKVAWNVPTNKTPGSIWISFPATALIHLEEQGGIKYLRKLFLFLRKVGFKCTRGDYACDDYDKSLNIAELHKALIAGNYTGFRNKRIITDFGENWTYYLGTAKADSMVRIYNKEAESKGLVKSFRLERQLKDEKAHKAFLEMCDIPDDEFYEMRLSEFCIRVAIGNLQFIDRTAKPNEKNLDRFPLLSFWEKFTDSIVPIVYSRTKVLHTVPRKMKWCVRSVFKSIAMLMQALGQGRITTWMIEEIVRAGNELSREQQNQVAAWQELYGTA